MRRSVLILFIVIGFEWLAAAAPVRAQVEMSGCKLWTSEAPTAEKLSESHFKLVGGSNTPVVVDCDQVKLVASEMELLQDENRVIARGHVVYTSATNRIYAERLDFNTKTKLGTFYVAYGTAHLGDRVDRSMFGTQEPYAYFYGDEIHKVGLKKYRIVRGGFTTCVQPTPRWEVTSGSVTLEMDEHAILRNSLFKVKGVPLMYLPIFWYPIQEDDRATGFLMPLYGNSTYRGQTISNQFFWAINRSQDLTLVHDWFSRTGQAYGGEYRYVASPASSGTARFYQVNEHEAKFVQNGVAQTTPAGRNYQIRADVVQGLPARTRLTGSVDYFSSIVTQQLYQQDLIEATKRTRRWSVGTTTSWSGFSLLSLYNRDEFFFDETESHVEGSRPRVSFSRSPTRLGPAPVYISGRFDYLNLQRESRKGETLRDTSLARVDSTGTVAVPFPSFSFLNVTSSIAWRGTRYSRSLDPVTNEVLLEPLFRKYVSYGTEIVGPSVVRIWHRPQSSYANRVKHLIEPRVEFTRQTIVDNVKRILKYDSSDFTIGGSTNIRYGVITRVLVKPAGEAAVSRNLLSVSMFQTYYTDPSTSQIDPNYSTSFKGREPSAFSPISILASFTPGELSGMTARIEYDPVVTALQSISLSGFLTKPTVELSGSFSHRLLATREDLLEGNKDFRSDNVFGTSATVRTTRNTLGATYSINYDFGRDTLVQQRILGYYNAQCCGIGFEIQEYNYPQVSSRYVIPRDRRFNLSFSLAGIGSFSNFLGALAGQPTRR